MNEAIEDELEVKKAEAEAKKADLKVKAKETSRNVRGWWRNTIDRVLATADGREKGQGGYSLITILLIVLLVILILQAL